MMENDELVTIAVIRDLTTAHLLRMTLESHGIEAQIFDVHTMSIAPHYAFFTGGARVMVPESEAAHALEILAREHAEHPGLERADINRLGLVCPGCGSSSVGQNKRSPLFWLFAGLLFGIPLLFTPGRKCFSCGRKFDP